MLIIFISIFFFLKISLTCLISLCSTQRSSCDCTDSAGSPPRLDQALGSQAVLLSFLDTQGTSVPSFPWLPLQPWRSLLWTRPALEFSQSRLLSSLKRQEDQSLPADWSLLGHREGKLRARLVRQHSGVLAIKQAQILHILLVIVIFDICLGN